MATRVYNQANITLTVDGTSISGFMDGTSIAVVHDGGEVEKTQGTDGPGINIATSQGMTLRFTLRETSPSHDFLMSLKRRQSNGGGGVTTVMRTGADVLYTLSEAYISNPGELTSGDKTQGGVEYTLTSADSQSSNTAIGTADNVISV